LMLFSRTRRPPIPTLFPYTTLFRSRTLILRTAGTNCDGETAYAFERAGAIAERLHVNRLLEDRRLLEGYQILAIPGGFSYGDDIDRKSTRLNSSHRTISYAVFCLKK